MIQIPTFSLRRRLVDEMYRTVYRAIIRDDKLLRFTFTSNKGFLCPTEKGQHFLSNDYWGNECFKNAFHQLCVVRVETDPLIQAVLSAIDSSSYLKEDLNDKLTISNGNNSPFIQSTCCATPLCLLEIVYDVCKDVNDKYCEASFLIVYFFGEPLAGTVSRFLLLCPTSSASKPAWPAHIRLECIASDSHFRSLYKYYFLTIYIQGLPQFDHRAKRKTKKERTV